MTRLFLDTEFLDQPWPGAPELISIGITDERGASFYAVNEEFNDEFVNAWVRENVVPHLSPRNSPEWMSASAIRERIVEMWPKVSEVWAFHGTWDWYLLVQRIFLGYMKIPEGWPRYFHELGMIKGSHLCAECPTEDGIVHHALADAKWNRLMYQHLMGK